ncbi:hypothetical protein [Nocardia sp. NPDC057353]|uniref:hypothetical protein n=1 Tax=Nocardia sp. NPDC057353 TaxID=3346104 RepID=UPI003631D6FE
MSELPDYELMEIIPVTDIDLALISVAEYETLEILSDSRTLADLRQSRVDFDSDATFDMAEVRAELEKRCGGEA